MINIKEIINNNKDVVKKKVITFAKENKRMLVGAGVGAVLAALVSKKKEEVKTYKGFFFFDEDASTGVEVDVPDEKSEDMIDAISEDLDISGLTAAVLTQAKDAIVQDLSRGKFSTFADYEKYKHSRR